MVERIQQNYNKSDEPSYSNFLEMVERLGEVQDANRLNFVTSSEGEIYLQVTEGEASIEGVGADSPQLERMVPFENFQLRSLMDVMFFLAKNTEVPDKHRDQVRAAEENGWLTIRQSNNQPGDALVWVKHNEHFFSIANADLLSKDTFALVKMLFEVQAGDIETVTPVLTLPVAQP